jgi:hypothetical protein
MATAAPIRQMGTWAAIAGIRGAMAFHPETARPSIKHPVEEPAAV